ncbi:MAG: orotidine-5'-phosphate decarboxylase [Methanomicrobiales archaeon]|nr:orotidine-5'-phosphate decarboxylase [Methanomicrobiales archaeon]
MAELILSLDVTERRRALNVATECAPFVDMIKVGYPLVLSTGIDIAGDLKKIGRPLIADFKVADIPNTNTLICEETFRSGFDGVIVHGFPGGDSVMACIEVAKKFGGSCFVVAEMSHPGAVEFYRDHVSERIALLAVQAGADGIIAPATRPERIERLRMIVGRRKIYAPGIGAQGGDLTEVLRHADGVIVGRAIYEAPEPGKGAEALHKVCHSEE